MDRTFRYFAYGSNLLQRRLAISCPSARRVAIGRLKNYRLDFITFSQRWRGASATIAPSGRDSSHVWGAVWSIDLDELTNLDRQEGVQEGIYYPFTVDVELPDGTSMSCRTYAQTATPPERQAGEPLPQERYPSAVYHKTILAGADESELPTAYRQTLAKIPNNGFEGPVNLDFRLDM